MPDVSLRFNERTAYPAVVFSRPPSGLIGGLPGCGPVPAGRPKHFGAGFLRLATRDCETAGIGFDETELELVRLAHRASPRR